MKLPTIVSFSLLAIFIAIILAIFNAPKKEITPEITFNAVQASLILNQCKLMCRDPQMASVSFGDSGINGRTISCECFETTGSKKKDSYTGTLYWNNSGLHKWKRKSGDLPLILSSHPLLWSLCCQCSYYRRYLFSSKLLMKFTIRILDEISFLGVIWFCIRSPIGAFNG